MLSERKPQTRRYGVAFLFLLSGTLAGIWHNRAVETGGSDMAAGALRTVIAPPAEALGRVSRWLGEQTGWLFRGRALAEENRRLKARLTQVEGEAAALREAQINHERLRADLGFVQAAKGRLLAADVIARRPDPKYDTMLLSRGSRDGVNLKSVVVTRNGVVGHVYEVTPTTASVLMLSDQNSSVGGRVQRANSRATGVCKGNNGPNLALVYLPTDADIRRGDVIVTSGIGGIYPPGLVIGVAQEVTADTSSLLKLAKIRPAVDFNRLEEVYIMR